MDLLEILFMLFFGCAGNAFLFLLILCFIISLFTGISINSQLKLKNNIDYVIVYGLPLCATILDYCLSKNIDIFKWLEKKSSKNQNTIVSNKYENRYKAISQKTPEDRAKDLISKKFDEITKNMNPDIVKSRKKDLLVYASSLLSEDKNALNKIYQGTSIQDYDKLIDDFHIREEKRLKNHISYEGRIGVRDKRILKEKLDYTCQACGLKMSEKYGNIGANYIELHHKVPYSQLQENDNRLLNVNDFCVLCPNCHRMIHKLENAGDIKLLKEILKSKSE